MLHYTTLVPFLGLRIGPACEACLSVGMGREGVPPCRRKKIKKEDRCKDVVIRCCTRSVRYGGCPVCNVLKVKVSISDCLPHLCVSQWSCWWSTLEENGEGQECWFITFFVQHPMLDCDCLVPTNRLERILLPKLLKFAGVKNTLFALKNCQKCSFT